MQINKKNYVDCAEGVIKGLLKFNGKTQKNELALSTSKIRNILSMVNELYNEVIHTKEVTLSEEIQYNVQYLKLRIAYEAGRDKTVEAFVKQAQLLGFLNQVRDNKETLLLFCRYMEALVAYHRFYGGKD